MKSSNWKSMLMLGGGLAAITHGAAFAQSATNTASTQLEEIVVTAERESGDLQKVAIAVTALSGDDLVKQGRYSQRQILEDVPGVSARDTVALNFSGGTDAGGNAVTIRGVSSNTSPTALSGVPTTAVYTDGVYEGIGGNYDLTRVEVLRGPQGTLYGRSATAGVVATYTNDPVFGDRSVEGLFEAGSYDLLHGSAAVNVSLTDTLALRVAGDHYERDGFYGRKGGAFEKDGLRAKLLFKPTDSLSILLGAAYEKNRSHTGEASGALNAPGNVRYDPAPIRSGENSFQQYWANVSWDLGPVAITYLPAFRTWKQDVTIYVSGPLGLAINNPVKTPLDDFITQELRVASTGDSRLKWQGGLFYYDNHVRNTNASAWDVSGATIYESSSQRVTRDLGVFGEARYAFTDAWRLTAGVRYNYTYVQTQQTYTSNLNALCNTPIPFPGCSTGPLNSPNTGLPESFQTLSLSAEDGTREFYSTTFKLRAEHDLGPANLVYAMVSSGFLPGDVQVNTGAGNVPTVRPYEQERLVAYEIGSKNRFLDNRLQLNGSAFYYNYGGLQSLIIPDQLNPGSALITSVPARYYGLELEAAWQLSSDDRLALNYAFVNARYRNKPAEFADAVYQDDIPGVIPHKLTGSYSHTFRFANGSSLTGIVDATYRSGYDVSSITTALAAQGAGIYVKQGGETTANLSATWTSPNEAYSVTGYLRNLTDNRFITSVGVQQLTPDLAASASQYDPRTWGLILGVKF